MENQKEPTVVILGDWYIDENWLISKLETYHASAPGDIHYMTLHKKANERITNLCAAAGLLLALRSYLLQEMENAPLSFLAFGVWNPQDNELFRKAICPDSEVKLLSPYTLSESIVDVSKCRKCLKEHDKGCIYEQMLVNLAEDSDSDKVSTNRIIRCFEGQSSGMPHQLYRFDWMLPCALDNKHWKKIGDKMEGRDIKAIIIVDHGAGAVNDGTIKQLVDATKEKNVPWFVHTKIDNAPWIQKFRDGTIELEMNIMDFHLAVHKKGPRRWWHGDCLGRSALELLGEMMGEKIYQDQIPVRPEKLCSRSSFVLLEDNTVFGMAKRKNSKKPQCVSIAHPIGQRQPVTIGRSTLFCAALFAQRLKSILNPPDKPPLVDDWVWQLKKECYAAACVAYDWTREASERWEEGVLSLHELYKSILENMDRFADKTVDNCVNTDYYEEWSHWNESSRDLGIINEKGKKVLQLWRGEGILKNYICVGGPKRNAINELVSAVTKFVSSKNPQHPFSCLIKSPPGWGKSFLARCLASHFDLEFLEFSVAQMCEDRDIMDCFAAIASVQSRTQKQTLVFIDEVNAEIQGHSVISSLLGPLWEGTFVKDRQTFRLRPGVWVFASTSGEAKLAEDKDKGSDFLSRLNGPIINLDSPLTWSNAILAVKGILSEHGAADLESFKQEVNQNKDYRSFIDYGKSKGEIDDHKTEQVYLMVLLLNNLWGPINTVEENVLKLFHDLLPINGYRSLELFAGCFEEIERGEVIVSNVPRLEDYAELRRHVIIPEEWADNKLRKSAVVKIETHRR
jgi:hypothetical protein